LFFYKRHGGRTDELQLLKLERKDRVGGLVDPQYAAVLPGAQVALLDELSVDAQLERKVAVDQGVHERDPELLSCRPHRARKLIARFFRKGEGEGGETPTLPAALSTKALTEDGPSGFTSYVSSSFPSHMIARLNCGKRRGIVRV
jgi:hypothetical protein